jgi:hypothetical protein
MVPSFENTVIFLDFDDTLFPTTWLHNAEPMPGDGDNLKLLEEQALSLLDICGRLGTLHIVTNAQEAWVMEVTRVFTPHLHDKLKTLCIYSCLDRLGDSEIEARKSLAFETITAPIRNCVGMLNVLSIGDDMFEIEAANKLGEKFGDMIKTVKMIGRPSTPKQMWSELSKIHTSIVDIAACGSNLQVSLKQMYGATDCG